MKIALVHDYLNEAGGAERVLRVLADMYPDAPIYTAFAKNGSAKKIFSDRQIVESKWGWLLKIGRFYSYFRFLLPWVWKSVDLTAYDLIITSCSGYIARGFRVTAHARVVAYCHTPPKWLYGYETPTDGQRKWWGKAYLWIFGPFVRYFDYRSAQRVTTWIANSQEVARRIGKFYRKKAIVVYPPVDIPFARDAKSRKSVKMQNEKKYYLTVARVVGAKGLTEAAAAARHARRTLVVVGEAIGGPTMVREIRHAGGKWVELVGRVSDEELAELYRGATGYLALARDEDFGMTVVEAMGQGVPVIALRSGGYIETVHEGKTGLFVDTVDSHAVAAAMKKLELHKWHTSQIATWAQTFNRARYEKEIRKIINA